MPATPLPQARLPALAPLCLPVWRAAGAGQPGAVLCAAGARAPRCVRCGLGACTAQRNAVQLLQRHAGARHLWHCPSLYLLVMPLQAAAPAPFYYFDEIDCALDTVRCIALQSCSTAVSAAAGGRIRCHPTCTDRHASTCQPTVPAACLPLLPFSPPSLQTNVARVAEFIAAQQQRQGSGAQYLVVSHKPQVMRSPRAGAEVVGTAEAVREREEARAVDTRS